MSSVPVQIRADRPQDTSLGRSKRTEIAYKVLVENLKNRNQWGDWENNIKRYLGEWDGSFQTSHARL
jgi:hypothetical protein